MTWLRIEIWYRDAKERHIYYNTYIALWISEISLTYARSVFQATKDTKNKACQNYTMYSTHRIHNSDRLVCNKKTIGIANGHYWDDDGLFCISGGGRYIVHARISNVHDYLRDGTWVYIRICVLRPTGQGFNRKTRPFIFHLAHTVKEANLAGGGMNA